MRIILLGLALCFLVQPGQAQEKPVFAFLNPDYPVNFGPYDPGKVSIVQEELVKNFKASQTLSYVEIGEVADAYGMITELSFLLEAEIDEGRDADEAFEMLALEIFETNTALVGKLRGLSAQEMTEVPLLQQIDFLVFPTLSSYKSASITNFLGQGAVVLEMNFFNINTRQVYSTVVGGPAIIDSTNAQQILKQLAADAVLSLEQTYQFEDPKAFKVLNEVRFLDIDLTAREVPGTVGIFTKVMGVGLTAYAAANLLGAFGTGNLSPYGRADLLSTVGVYGGTFWAYSSFATTLERPFMKSQRRKLRREFRKITGSSLPDMYADPKLDEEEDEQ